MSEVLQESGGKPVLTALQRAWLQEIGIDRRMLAHLSTAPFAEPEPVAARTPVVDTARPVQVGELLKRAVPGQSTPAHSPAGASRGADANSAGISPVAATAAQPIADASLEALRSHTEQCVACGLHEVRARPVFGEGTEDAPHWMFIGEAPGEYDDSTGRPFQGRAGELLHAMLASVGITDASPVYFTNVLKCRPMMNRSPEPGEIAACMPLLRRQIQLLRPQCLVALGRVSAGALLGRSDELDALRGEVHAYVDEDGRSIPVVVTHHPATLLLHAQHKADAWRDLNLMRDLVAGPATAERH